MGIFTLLKGNLGMSKNYLVETKEIKDEILTMIEEIENDNR